MLVEFGIDDGYQVNGREFTAEVSDEDLADCPTLECAQNVIYAAIQEEFEQRICWYSKSMDPDQSRALWEAAKAAQGGNNARK